MLNHTVGGQVHVEVITLALYYAAEIGGYFYVAPAYKSALEDIERFYPRLKFHQNIITSDKYRLCAEMDEDSDDLLAAYYFKHEAKWEAANVTVFLNAVNGTVYFHSLILCPDLRTICFPDCDSRASALMATELQSLILRYG